MKLHTALMLGVLLGSIACSREGGLVTMAHAAPPAGGATGKTGTGQIKGTAKLEGKPPAMPTQARDSDPYCKGKPGKDQDVVVGKNGGLTNVVVRVAKGAEGSFAPPSEPVEVDQAGCQYKPHVAAAMTGQRVIIKNTDQTLHNVHAYKGASTAFNKAQISGAKPLAHTAGAAGEVLKLKCDVHPWMLAWVVASDNPFVTVSGPDGSFTLDKLPDGKYTLEAWHERYGKKTADVTVTGGKAEVAFTFK